MCVNYCSRRSLTSERERLAVSVCPSIVKFGELRTPRLWCYPRIKGQIAGARHKLSQTRIVPVVLTIYFNAIPARTLPGYFLRVSHAKEIPRQSILEDNFELILPVSSRYGPSPRLVDRARPPRQSSIPIRGADLALRACQSSFASLTCRTRRAGWATDSGGGATLDTRLSSYAL